MSNELFIYNEVYPFDEDKAYAYFKERMDKCGNDDKCHSWVKHDAETYVKEHAKRVGEKIELTGESGFWQVGGVHYGIEWDRKSVIKWLSFFAVVIFILYAMAKKNLLLGSFAMIAGVTMAVAPKMVFGDEEKVQTS